MRRGNTGRGCRRRGGSSRVDSTDKSFFFLHLRIWSVGKITDWWGLVFSWSKQIIEHERAEAAKEAAAAAAAAAKEQ